MSGREADGARGPLAAKIQALFERQTRPVSDHQHARDIAASGNPHAPRRQAEFSHSAVARAIGSTDTYVTQLRNGQRDNPNLKLIQRLADFFGVDVTYLVKDEIAVGDLPLYVRQRSVRDRVNTLFEKVRPAGPANPAFSDDAVAAAIGVDVAQLSRLRDGSDDDPGLKLLRALAEYFGVPAEYLTTSDAKVIARIDEQLDLLADYLPVAARHLSSDVLADNASLGAIAAVLRHVRTQNAKQAEGRPGDRP
ncbi:helix-turn-helix transcriptional regulator [Kutzneria sp. NPDC052558]|uniref:helix-turn-helix transcriptional regulator n=1 Tax=Kutzneria sp. NPDC052558 TaxID=3364121 RepID=UPI0037CB0FE8